MTIPPLDIALLRLQHQRLSREFFSQPNEVVRWLVAVQSQDYASARWGLGMRLQPTTDCAIEQAFDAGAILRTHLLRPTWHFVVPEDIRWLLALTAPRVHAANAFMVRKLELDQDNIRRSSQVLARALQGGQSLTRAELEVVLTQVGLAPGSGSRMSYILMAAELDGVLCSGPRRGKQFTYMLLEERVPPAPAVLPEEALAYLAGRYFRSRGPATAADFAKWSGLTLAEARRGLDAVKPQLVSETIQAQTYWFPAAQPLPEIAAPTAWLLSIYDEYISSYTCYTPIADAVAAARLKDLGTAATSILLIDGQVRGTWQHTLHKEAVRIATQPFSAWSSAEEEAITAAAQRYAAFHELPLLLTL